jgi:hypothetical protein
MRHQEQPAIRFIRGEGVRYHTADGRIEDSDLGDAVDVLDSSKAFSQAILVWIIPRRADARFGAQPRPRHSSAVDVVQLQAVMIDELRKRGRAAQNRAELSDFFDEDVAALTNGSADIVQHVLLGDSLELNGAAAGKMAKPGLDFAGDVTGRIVKQRAEPDVESVALVCLANEVEDGQTVLAIAQP